MPRVNTLTRTSFTKTENNSNDVSFLTPPTRDEVITQLKKHFAEHTKEVVNSEDISRIADAVSNSFDELRDKPYGGFAKYSPEKPKLTIKMLSFLLI